MKMIRHILIIFLLLTFCAANSFAEPELKGTPSELENYLGSIPKTVSLFGEKTLEVQAKRGIVTVNVTTEDESLEKASQTNQRLRSEIVSKLISRGISKEDIVGSKFSSTPEFGLWSKKPKSYKVENSLKITIESEKEYQSVANIIDTYEEATYKGIEFKHDDKDAIKEQLVKLILENLRAKKSLYEKELGVKLLPIKFYEQISSGEPPVVLRERKALRSAEYSQKSYAPLSFGETKFHGRVTVEYKVTR
jgi:uncharacterized protein YggE